MKLAILLVLAGAVYQAEFSAAKHLDVEDETARMLAKREDCGGKADFVFLLDESGSVGSANFEKTKDFVKSVISKFSVGQKEIQFGLVTYGSYPRNQFNLNSYSSSGSIMRAIDAITFESGGTNTASGLAYTSRYSFTSSSGARKDVPKVVVLITDGRSNDRTETRRQAQLAKDAGIVILVIGVGGSVDSAELDDIGSKPNSRYVFRVQTFDALKTMNGLVSKTACEEACINKADFMFLLDESNSVGGGHFNTMKTFVKNVIKKFDVGPKDIQFGLVTYGSRPRNHFDLDRYSSSGEIMAAIDAIKFGYGYTRTAEGLRFLVSHSYSVAAGARNDVPWIAVVVTDGLSTNKTATRTEATLAKAAGITILAVGVGDAVDDNELRDIASDPDSQYVFKVDSFQDLKSIQDLIAKTACRGVASSTIV